MKDSYHHIILVVDDDESVGRTFGDMLKKEKIGHVLAGSAESALNIIRKTKSKFPVIVSDQDLEGVNGIKFLEQAKTLSPLSSLFLMADHTDIKTIISAVNKGIIQRYIVKPLNADNLVNTIQSGIKLYKFLLGNEKLLRLAKSQNANLYDLNCELMEATKANNKTIHQLDEDIAQIKNTIRAINTRSPVKPGVLSENIKNYINEGDSANIERIQALFSESIRELYAQFTDLANRNGFDMPIIVKETGSGTNNE